MNEILIEQGKRFRIARKGLRITQTEVARRINVNQVSISNFENGNRMAEFPEYMDFMISQGIDEDWLLHGDTNTETEAKERIDYSEVEKLRNELSALKLEKVEYQQIIKEQKDIIGGLKKVLADVPDLKKQITNLTNSLTDLMAMVAASGMQLLPKQQIIGEQQDFNNAGVSSQFLEDLAGVIVLKTYATQYAKNLRMNIC